ncbi:MAG: hypothetical protein JRN28_03285 [Nitrososphaerota archaeon]|nr:hypothetical protein [Nitrososphaerota archaeon]
MTEEKKPTWEEYIEDGLREAEKDMHQTELLSREADGGGSTSIHPSWVYSADIRIVRLYRIVEHLEKRLAILNDLIDQLLDADKSVPKEEIQTRAELLGLFVHALRERTQGASP